jgi:hypothetical protein
MLLKGKGTIKCCHGALGFEGPQHSRACAVLPYAVQQRVSHAVMPCSVQQGVCSSASCM